MDILTRIKNPLYKNEISILFKKNKLELDDIPINYINDLYFSMICKLVQDINEINQEITSENLTNNIIYLLSCKSRKNIKFDIAYKEIINDINNKITKLDKFLI
jgi:hypothetical protein